MPCASMSRVRAADPHSSWLVSQLAVLDAEALHLAACPESAPLAQLAAAWPAVEVVRTGGASRLQ